MLNFINLILLSNYTLCITLFLFKNVNFILLLYVIVYLKN